MTAGSGGTCPPRIFRATIVDTRTVVRSSASFVQKFFSPRAAMVPPYSCRRALAIRAALMLNDLFRNRDDRFDVPHDDRFGLGHLLVVEVANRLQVARDEILMHRGVQIAGEQV